MCIRDSAVGNVQTKIIKFVTFTEQASINEDIKPINGTTIKGCLLYTSRCV